MLRAHKHTQAIRMLVTVSIVAFGLLILVQPASAATVTVTAKTDLITADGNCELREAIINVNNQANTHADCTALGGYGTNDRIEFAITGTADFTRVGQNGYTIQPGTAFPTLSTTVTIDGYTQPGTQPNTADAPNPLNGILLIEIDGQNAGSVNGLDINSNNTVVQGLIINRFQGNAVRFANTQNSKLLGSYIGTDPTGLIARNNGTNNVNSSTAVSIGENGLNSTDLTTVGVTVGGTAPSSRNIVSGNYGGGFGIGAVNTTIQGNYVGVGSDGTTNLGNSLGANVTTGNLTIDYADGVLIGGEVLGATNVISGAKTGGIQPDYSTGVVVQGNNIGTDYTGTVAIPNELAGVSFSLGTTNSMVGGSSARARNIIRFNGTYGVAFSGASGNSVLGNIISNNTDNGVRVFAADNIRIGESGGGNVIYGNGAPNIEIRAYSGFGYPINGVIVQGNSIGFDTNGVIAASQGIGIQVIGDPANVLIGGVNSGDGNIIKGTKGAGVAITSLTLEAASTTVNSNNVAVLGNSISGTNPSVDIPAALGIDLLYGVDTDGPPDAIPNFYTESGPTLNDAGDPDTGPNSFMNFPVINSATQNGTDLFVDLDLDAANTTDPAGNYRVEFFANDAADASGYGEGQTYLGFANVSNGTGKVVQLSLAPNTNLTGKVLSATTTAINNSATSGFGSTSEFSSTRSISVVSQGTLAETGNNMINILLVASGFVIMGLGLGVTYRRMSTREARSHT